MRLDGDHLDADEARRRGATELQVSVIRLWNDDTSWRAIAATLGITISSARKSYAAVNRRLRGGDHNPNPITAAIPLASSGNEDLCRGIPIAGIGGGAIHGTRPGDPAWRAVADHSLEITRRRGG